MPLGIPKVPFPNFGDDDDEDKDKEKDDSWIDLYNGLYRQRAIFLGQKLDNTIGNQILGLLLYLSVDDPEKDIDFFINSPGGSLILGAAIHDLMEAVEPDVQTVCIGTAASMASFILLGGATNKRIAFPHARIMMHQPIADLIVKIRTGDSVMEMKELIELYRSIVRTYAKKTRKPLWLMYKDIARDTFMSAREAQYYGIVDYVGTDRVIINGFHSALFKKSGIDLEDLYGMDFE